MAACRFALNEGGYYLPSLVSASFLHPATWISLATDVIAVVCLCMQVRLNVGRSHRIGCIPFIMVKFTPRVLAPFSFGCRCLRLLVAYLCVCRHAAMMCSTLQRRQGRIALFGMLHPDACCLPRLFPNRLVEALIFPLQI